jgi:OmcA/MtrC family decaheme c-type cytochrome
MPSNVACSEAHGPLEPETLAMKNLPRISSRIAAFAFILTGAAFLGAIACKGSDGDTGPQGPPGGDGTDNTLEQGDSLPGLTVSVVSLTGGSASGGHFRVGDRPRVNYRLQKTDGSDWDITELSSGRALISGPTFNYQRVILEQTDLLTASVKQADDSYTYTFPTPIPATYLAPMNDTPAFGPDDGELTGQPLLDGTYTVALTFSWDYTVDGNSERDSGNATFDFVVGNAGTVDSRQVVKIENCNRCHDQLRIHGGRREEVTVCVLCHTSGAEASGTPGVSLDFKVLIHKLHTGEHLPSVLGVATNPDGSRNYAAPPTPYIVSGEDFSHVAFPAWPNGLVPMPRDQGYSSLSPADQSTEDTIRMGPSNCAVCHGDPDGDGPLTAPAQGAVAFAQPSRQACGSCHDDLSWGQPYTSNGQTMGAQANNSNCTLCHAVSGNGIAVQDAHTHPLLDPNFNPGLNLDVTNLVEAGANNGDATIDPGEKIQVSLHFTDDAGADVDPATISAPSVVISGPTENYNLILNTTIPSAALTGAQPFTVNLPMTVNLERLGVSTAGLDTFTSAFTPHWNVTNALTSVLVRTATAGGNAVLTAASVAPQNYVDVDNPAGFARNDYVVVADGGGASEEYVRIQFVDGNRLWFSSPYTGSFKAGMERPHAIGTTVREVTLVTKTAGVDFSVDAPAGQITELIEFGNGNTVIATYTTDFVMPSTYPLVLNASPDLGDESGKWTGKSIVDGTYTVGIWSSKTLTLTRFGETNTYKSTSDSKDVDFLVGSAAVIEPYQLIASGSSCFNCHQELAFHGFGRRGFESCVLCHGTAGAEDRPQYVAGAAPATTGATVSFRTMLHKIHMGENLTNAADYDIVGFGSGAYPNNFSVSNFSDIVFPSQPGGVANCIKCHGNDAWHEPQPRAHPTQQDLPIKRWSVVCGACHDSTDAQAHINVQTDPAGNESCGVCHGPGREEDVVRVHKTY